MQKGKKVQLVMIMGLIQQEDITILNVSAPNKSFKICETNNTTARENRKTHNYTWVFHHLFLSNSKSRLIISQDTEDINSTINKLDLPLRQHPTDQTFFPRVKAW